MPEHQHPHPHRRLLTRPLLLALAAAGLFTASADAGQASAALHLTINLAGAGLQSGTCGTGRDAATVQCKSGPYGFFAFVKKDNVWVVGDDYARLSTSTAYRVVSLADWQYIEMTVGW